MAKTFKFNGNVEASNINSIGKLKGSGIELSDNFEETTSNLNIGFTGSGTSNMEAQIDTNTSLRIKSGGDNSIALNDYGFGYSTYAGKFDATSENRQRMVGFNKWRNKIMGK